MAVETINIKGVTYQVTDEAEVLGPVGVYPFVTYYPKKGTKTANGRIYYNFRNDKGEQCNAYLHYLVAKCFIPNPHGWEHVKVKDGDWGNCKPDNLEWCEKRYSISPGRPGATALKDADASVIRDRVAAGETQAELAREYKVSPSLISRIIGRSRYVK